MAMPRREFVFRMMFPFVMTNWLWWHGISRRTAIPDAAGQGWPVALGIRSRRRFGFSRHKKRPPANQNLFIQPCNMMVWHPIPHAGSTVKEGLGDSRFPFSRGLKEQSVEPPGSDFTAEWWADGLDRRVDG